MATLYKPGDVIRDNYRVYDIKEGGMGIVYLCHRLDVPMDMALKTIREEYLADPNVRERILREAEIWTNLGGHPNIVRCWGAEFIRSQLFLFLGLVKGAPGMQVELRSYITHHLLGPTDSINIAIQICIGMKYAQERVPGLVHRDLKPENVLISADGTVKVTDFGLAAALGSGKPVSAPDDSEDDLSTAHPALTRVGTTWGTPPYMSPEQCRGDMVDVRSDIYAVGCILFEMLTGQQIFPVRSVRSFIHHHLYEEPRPLHAVDSSLPAELEHIVSRCLQKDIQARYPDFVSLMADLREAFEAIERRPPRFKVSKPDPEMANLMASLDLFVKARTYREIGRVQQALEIYRQLIASGEAQYHEEAICLLQLGRHEEAEASFKKALELEPDNASIWHDVSVFYTEQGRLGESLSCNQRSLELNPEESGYWDQRGYILNRLGNEKEAMGCFRRAFELDQTDENACTNVGVCLANRGELQEALDYQKLATTLAPAFPQAWLNKGGVHVALGQHEEALACFDKALALDPSLSKAWTAKGQTQSLLGQWTEALASVDGALALDPGLPEAWAIKSQVQTQLGQLAEAQDSIDRALALNSGLPEAWMVKGQLQHKLGHLVEALTCLDKALTQNPDLQIAWTTKGQIQAELGQLMEALASLNRALALAPDSAETWMSRAWIQARLNRPIEAQDSLDRALEIDPTFRAALLTHIQSQFSKPEEALVAAHMLCNLGKLEDALACCHKALQLAPANSTILEEVAVILNRLGRHREALSYIERALEIAPDKAITWYNKGVIYAALEMFEGALDCYERSLSLDSGDCDVWHNKGIALNSLGRHEEALFSFEQAVKINSSYASAYAERGVAYFSLQRYDEAMEDFTRAIQLDPTLARAHLNIGVVLGNWGRWREALHHFEKAAQLGEPRGTQYVELARQALGEEAAPRVAPGQFRVAFEAFLRASSLGEMQSVVTRFPFITNITSFTATPQFAMLQIPPDLRLAFEQRLVWLRQVISEQEHENERE